MWSTWSSEAGTRVSDLSLESFVDSSCVIVAWLRRSAENRNQSGRIAPDERSAGPQVGLSGSEAQTIQSR